MRNFIIWGALVLGLGGCISSEAREEISINAAVSDAVIQRWDTLTDDQQKQAYWKQARAWHNLDYSVNDKPIPEKFLTDPWAVAPVSSDVPANGE